MIGVLGLLTGWALLTLAVLTLYLMLGGPYFGWMSPFMSLASSLPLLMFLTVAGIALIFLSVKRMGSEV